jgi:hypothetical protein
VQQVAKYWFIVQPIFNYDEVYIAFETSVYIMLHGVVIAEHGNVHNYFCENLKPSVYYDSLVSIVF